MAKPSGKVINRGLWVAYLGFVVIAFWCLWRPEFFALGSATGLVRLALIGIWIAFLGYSIHCSRQESLFRTIGVMNKLYWGRQIGTDLYISVFLSIGLAYLVTGSVVETLLWALAFIPFANLAILPFVILYLDRIVAMASSLG